LKTSFEDISLIQHETVGLHKLVDARQREWGREEGKKEGGGGATAQGYSDRPERYATVSDRILYGNKKQKFHSELVTDDEIMMGSRAESQVGLMFRECPTKNFVRPH
jgi:hypothetical protein